MKKKQRKISLAIDPEIDNILEKNAHNKSKLINMLLEKYLKEQKNIEKIISYYLLKNNIKI